MSELRERLKPHLPWSSNHLATQVFETIREPDPHAVAAVADALKMDATKVAAVWMLMVDEALK